MFWILINLQVPLWRFHVYLHVAFVLELLYKCCHPLVQSFPLKSSQSLHFLSGFLLLPGQLFFWYWVNSCDFFHLHERHAALDVASVPHWTGGFDWRWWWCWYRPTLLHQFRSFIEILGFAGIESSAFRCLNISKVRLCILVFSNFFHSDVNCSLRFADFYHHNSSLFFHKRVSSLLKHFVSVPVLFVQHV